jgi:hypothetical protein
MKTPLSILTLSLLSLTPAFGAESSGPKNLTLELKGEDAEALYTRLERKENPNDGFERIRTKVGQAVLCTEERPEEKLRILHKPSYICSLSFEIENGEMHEMYPIGETDTKAGIKKPKGYQGRLITIKENSSDAVLRILEVHAVKIYAQMSAEPTLGAIVDGKIQAVQESELPTRDQNGTLVKVKTGKHVQCFQSIETLAPATNCLLTIETKTGKPKKAESPGATNETPAGN